MSLNGIDTSSWQAGLRPASMSTTKFIISKATGGTGYLNPVFKRHADETLAAKKLLGLYHYARERGSQKTAKQEAAWFVNNIKPYLGKAVLALDWEEDLHLGPGWVKEFCDEVKRLTGVVPIVYTSKSVTRSYNFTDVAKTYKLWGAQYANYNITGYQTDPWNDGLDWGAWGKTPWMRQYSGTGRIRGYSGNLDLDLFYSNKAAWQNACAIGKKSGTEPKEKIPYICLVNGLRVREKPSLDSKVLAHYDKGQIIWGIDGTIKEDGIVFGTYVADSGKRRYIALRTVGGKTKYMRKATEEEQKGTQKKTKINRMATFGVNIANDDSHGYSQIYRWPVEGPDFDCASLMYWCAYKAGYNVTIGPAGIHYTGTMLNDFQNAGFKAIPFSSVGLNGLKKGDILLNTSQHTEMYIGNGQFVGAHCSETGGIYGKAGDQTGNEISVCKAYVPTYGWNYVLRPPA